MALFLVQHGKCLPGDVDPDRPLTEDGIADVKRIADVASGYRVAVNEILHSGKTRARQTAELFADKLNPPEGVAETDGLNPKDDVKALAGILDNTGNIMIVGHLPFMEKLTSFLVTGYEDLKIFKFQNGGIVCLDKNEGFWIIKWTLMPAIG